MGWGKPFKRATKGASNFLHDPVRVIAAAATMGTSELSRQGVLGVKKLLNRADPSADLGPMFDPDAFNQEARKRTGMFRRDRKAAERSGSLLAGGYATPTTQVLG